MSNIIEFPTKDTQTDDLYLKLGSYHVRMDEVYANIDQLHCDFQRLLEEAKELEIDYDELLAKYVDLVGADDLEVRMLQYSSNAVVEVDADEGTFSIRWEEGSEEEVPNDVL